MLIFEPCQIISNKYTIRKILLKTASSSQHHSVQYLNMPSWYNKHIILELNSSLQLHWLKLINIWRIVTYIIIESCCYIVFFAENFLVCNYCIESCNNRINSFHHNVTIDLILINFEIFEESYHLDFDWKKYDSSYYFLSVVYSVQCYFSIVMIFFCLSPLSYLFIIYYKQNFIR